MKYTYFYKATIYVERFPGMEPITVDGFWETEFKINSGKRGLTVHEQIKEHIQSIHQGATYRFTLDCLTYLG